MIARGSQIELPTVTMICEICGKPIKTFVEGALSLTADHSTVDRTRRKLKILLTNPRFVEHHRSHECAPPKGSVAWIPLAPSPARPETLREFADLVKKVYEVA